MSGLRKNNFTFIRCHGLSCDVHSCFAYSQVFPQCCAAEIVAAQGIKRMLSLSLGIQPGEATATVAWQFPLRAPRVEMQDDDKDASENDDSFFFKEVEREEEQYDRLAKQHWLLTKKQLLDIDLSRYDRLVTYPADNNWPLEREKILFLQTAVRLGFPFYYVVHATRERFGATLKPPPYYAAVFPAQLNPFLPPVFDVARQTPEEWGVAADRAWHAYRAAGVRELSEWRQREIDGGSIKEFKRRRKSDKLARRKVAIADEKTAFEWAVHWFLGTSLTKLAFKYPPPSGYSKIPRKAAKERRKRAEQIRSRATLILKRLGVLEFKIRQK
jgi:hypothetical protein